MRASLAAAAAASPPLKPRAWKTLAAILRETASYSRTTEELTHQQILRLGNLSSRGEVHRALIELAAAGAIMYRPSRGHYPSLIALPDRAPVGGDPRDDRAETGGDPRDASADDRAETGGDPRDDRAPVGGDPRDDRAETGGDPRDITRSSSRSSSEFLSGDDVAAEELRTNDILKTAIEPGAGLPRDYVGHLARRVKRLLDEGQPAERVQEAARLCVERGRDPTALPSIVVEIATRGSGSGWRPYQDPPEHEYLDTRIR